MRPAALSRKEPFEPVEPVEPVDPIGSIFTQLAGARFYNATLAYGERIHLEREPDNPHDSHAIRVDDHAFHPAGHLPRRVADWLAPLIDAGKVQVEGAVNGVDRTRQPSRAYLKLDLHLHPKGEAILKMQADPVGSASAMHQAVLQVWNLMKEWTDPDAARSVGRQLIGLATDQRAPETRMLLNLIRSRGRALEAAAGAFLRDLAAGLRVLDGAEGPGRQLEIDGDRCSGAGLWFAGRACHVAGFGKPERMTREGGIPAPRGAGK